MKTSYLILLYLFFLVACSGNEEIVKIPTVENKYDPTLPLSADRIKPAYGSIDNVFVVEGNFKGDISDMKVYFGNKPAVLVATDGRSIMGIVPKQPPGNNSISVVTGRDSLAPANLKFKYRQTQTLKTVAGVLDQEGSEDGDLNAARFTEASHIATVKGQKGDNIIVSEAWWIARLRLISLDDNKVITLATSISSFGTPAVDKSREKFYAIGIFDTGHDIYSFSRANGWLPVMTGIKIAQKDANTWIHGLQFFGEDEQYLYALSTQCQFFRINLKDKSYQQITLHGTLPTVFGWRSALIYSKYHDCFFASFSDEHGIYKIYNTGGSLNPGINSWQMEKYAGFNGPGGKTGHRLNDAQFHIPYGLTVTSAGEIFVINRNGHFINKISGDRVELVAGKLGVVGATNDDPLEALFNQPQDIAVDSDDNLYIAGGGDRTVRKLSIE